MATPHKGQTGKITEVKLTSTIERVMWARMMAAPGATVGIDVWTRFVGSGAAIEITLSDQSGKKLGTFKEKIYANRFGGAITLPANASGAVIAEVKLPKHGITASSPALLVGPPITIENLKWSAKEARRGDVLKLTADVRKAPDGADAEISIWEHDSDGAHDPIARFPAIVQKERIEAEWEFEYVEDTDDIPADPEVETGYQHPEYFFRVDVYGVVGESPLLPFKDVFELALTDDNGRPIGKADYVLKLADGTERRGKLNDDGTTSEKDLPPGPVEVSFPGVEDRDELQGV
ncbi:MAG TPA: hypothetical protein VF190_10420 [Rhodothermales bacterium]